MKDNKLLVELNNHIAFLTIHHPEKRNALTSEILKGIHTNLEEFSGKDNIRCIVIKGSGDKTFSSGYDIAAIADNTSPGIKQRTPDMMLQAFSTLKKFPYPTIAMLNGSAFGAGFNLSACCDIRIASDDIRLGMTPARLGVAYHPEGIQQFIEAFGLARTKEIFYTAGVFEGQDLLEKGLVDHIIPRKKLDSFVVSYAQKITQNAPLSLKGIKQIIRMFEDKLTLNQSSLDKADKIMQTCFKSNDLKEGKAAFQGKRSPRFTGQ